MGLRVIRVMTILALLACAAGAFYWYRWNYGAGRRTLAFAPAPEPGSFSPPKGAPAAHGAEHGSTPAAGADPIRNAESPVHAGEVLEFSANVSKLNNVANLRVQVNERRDFLGQSAWHLQAFAHTENPLRMVFALDDQFDSYSNAASMASLQYEMHLNERGQKVDSVQRMTATGKDVAPANVTEARVPAGTRDPLGLLQYIRGVDWSKTPELRSSVYDGHKLYDVRARQESAAQDLSVPAGDFRTSKITIRVFDNGTEMKDAQFALYLANNPARTPLLIEAVLPFATARVELVKISGR